MDMLSTIFAPPSLHEFIVICGMLVATYSTRLIGWLVLRNRPVSPTMQRVLDAAPGCVMISIVAPAFMTTNVVTLVTLAATVLVAFRAHLAVTILFAVGFNALLQTFF
ncbi:AzlD family protein [Sutterella sp.]|uniref:AzlD family protein n=1 Tax=Sutterella sp. TaxID=1981025 RepID=UPI0026DEB87B|nr:AzlD domain-containing protein [Sutterella sp.]MDO5532175.1 AzlD domain-containing protein [Sutterella sp.]